MKTLKFLAFLLFAMTFAFVSCSDDDDDDNGNGNGNGTNPADTVATDNLVAYFKFDGDINDEQGHTTTGENVQFTFDRYSNENSAYMGSETSFVRVENPDDLRMNSMTFSMWLRAQQLEAGTNFIISFIDPDMDWNEGYAIWQEQSARGDTLRYKAVTRHMNSSLFGWMDTEYDMPDAYFPSAKWFHFVFAYDGDSSIRDVYLDGNRVARDTLIFEEDPLGPVTIPESATEFYIGTNPNTVQEWIENYTGDLDDLRIYNIALTEEQVQAIHEGEMPE